MNGEPGQKIDGAFYLPNVAVEEQDKAREMFLFALLVTGEMRSLLAKRLLNI